MTPRTALATKPRAQRRASRRPQVQHLITADEHSLVELEALLATLPLCTTGRIFVEVPDADSIVPLSAPPRMTISWLPRASRSGAPGTGRRCAPGAAVSRAAIAWADEMLCVGDTDAPASLPTRITLLGGFVGTADIVDHLTGRLGVERAAIDAPERFSRLV